MGVRKFLSVNKPQLIARKAPPPNVESKTPYGMPCFDGFFLSTEYRTRIKTNSEGFRDIEHKLDKPKDVFRVLIVGDSFTFGLGVEGNQTYPKILEELLNEEGANRKFGYEIFNMSMPGIGTPKEFEIIQYGIRYNPDLILLGFFVEDRWNPGNGNDLCDNFKSYHKSKYAKSIEEVSATLLLRLKTKLINRLNSIQRFLNTHSELYFLIMTKKGTTLRRNLIRYREGQNRHELDIAWDITKDELEKINAFSQKRGVEFVIVRIPFLYDVHNREEDRVSKILAEFGRKNDINICDPLAVFRNNRDRDLYYPADGHWKVQAHTLAAREIFKYLVNKNLIDSE